MGKIVSLDPDLMRTQADTLANIGGEIADINLKLENLVAEIVANWSGAACDAFEAQYEEIKSAFTQTVTICDTVHNQLYSSAAEAEDTDSRTSSMFGIK